MTLPPMEIDAPASSRAHADWRHGGASHTPITRSRTPRAPGVEFLSQSVLARVGVAMLGAGALLVALGAYGAMQQPGSGSRIAMLLAVGFLGLTTAVVGGFLYLGSWIARLVEDNRSNNRRLSETLLALADVTAQSTAGSADVGGVQVTVGAGTVIHRRDCPLVAYRPDLVPADNEDQRLSHCRVCTV